MQKFNIEIKETLRTEILINAFSMEEALKSAEALYNKEEIVLDYNHHNSTDIDISSLETFSNDSGFLNFILQKAEKSLVDLPAEELARIGFGNLSNAIEEYFKEKE